MQKIYAQKRLIKVYVNMTLFLLDDIRRVLPSRKCCGNHLNCTLKLSKKFFNIKKECKHYEDIQKRLEKLISKINKFNFKEYYFKLSKIRNNHNKVIFSVNKNKEITILLKLLTSSLSYYYNIKQNNRNLVISSLLEHLQTTNNGKLYKLDIKNFYESVSIEKLNDYIKNNYFLYNDILNPTNQLFNTLLDIKNNHSELEIGIPRGLSISSFLSEWVLQDFDNYIRNNENVIFYQRFVDDIIVITNGYEEITEPKQTKMKKKFIDIIKEKLNIEGLIINQDKFKEFELQNEYDFDFLGYNFQKSKSNMNKLVINISEKKIKKIKSKIVLLIKKYKKNKNKKLLISRLKVITSNYKYFNNVNFKINYGGLLYSYPKLSVDSPSLQNLDNFLFKQIKIHKIKLEKNFSFVRGYKNKIFYKFNQSQIQEIFKVWKNV